MVYIRKTQKGLRTLLTLCSGFVLIVWVFMSGFFGGNSSSGTTFTPHAYADTPHTGDSDSDAGCATASGTGCGCGYCEDLADNSCGGCGDSDSADGTDCSGDGAGDNGASARA